MVLAWYWHGIGMILARYWHGLGLVLVWSWHGLGLVLAWYWHGLGMVDGRRPLVATTASDGHSTFDAYACHSLPPRPTGRRHHCRRNPKKDNKTQGFLNVLPASRKLADADKTAPSRLMPSKLNKTRYFYLNSEFLDNFQVRLFGPREHVA